MLFATHQGTVHLKQGVKKNFTIRVLPRRIKKQWLDWIKFLSKFPKLQWFFSKDQFQISGSILRFKTWKQLAHFSKLNNISYSLQAFIHNKVKSQAINFFSKILESHSFKIQWALPPILFLHKEKKDADFISHYGIKIQTNHGLFFSPSRIELQFLFSSLDKNLSKHFNLQMSASDSQLKILKNPISEIVSTLQHLKNKGHGQVLTSNKILTESGESFRFFMGGEIPIYDFHLESQTSKVTFKPYGFSLTATPTLKSKNIIHLQLVIDISEIDPTYSTTKSPATKNYRQSMGLHLEEGKTLLLSQFERIQKGKFLSQPTLFSFFPIAMGSFSSKKANSKEKTKSYLFITPKIIRNSQEEI